MSAPAITRGPRNEIACGLGAVNLTSLLRAAGLPRVTLTTLAGRPAEAATRLVAGLPPAGQETVARFAGFLAAWQTARVREKTR